MIDTFRGNSAPEEAFEPTPEDEARALHSLRRYAIGLISRDLRRFYAVEDALQDTRIAYARCKIKKPFKHYDQYYVFLGTILRRRIKSEAKRYSAKKRRTLQDVEISEDNEPYRETEHGLDVETIIGTLEPQYQHIIRARLEGYTNEEIAEQMNCVTRTVERYLAKIRQEPVIQDLLKEHMGKL